MDKPAPNVNSRPDTIKIAVGMSGGTDSSVAAALLVDQGYQVIGLTAQMWKEGSRCCSLEAVENARKVCWHLNIRHVVVNLIDDFMQHVALPFADEYIQGRTPSPCVHCNRRIKFGALLTRAVAFGCDALATGHYARIVDRDGSRHLTRGQDRTRDQSYFLHRLSQRQLAHVQLPLGDLLKQEDVIPYAQTRGLPIATKSESRDICFAPPGQHHTVVERLIPNASHSGDIVDMQGNVMGQHDGIHLYTVGQRRGLGLSGGPPLYVVRIDATHNRIVVGSREDASSSRCTIRDVHWISGQPPSPDQPCAVALRYQHGPADATLMPTTNGCYGITFRSPQFGVAPGQAAVVYCGDEVMGGGWITDRQDR